MLRFTPTRFLKVLCVSGLLLSAASMAMAAGKTGPYVYVGGGESFANFTASDFENVVQKNFSPDAINFTRTSTDFHSTIGELSVGYQILSWLGIEAGAQTPYTTSYKSNFTDIDDSNRLYSDKFNDKIHLYNAMLVFNGNIGKLPINEFIKAGVAYESLEVDYDQNNLTSGTSGNIRTADDHAYLPAAALGIAYNFKQLNGLSVQGQWLHVEGRTASIDRNVVYSNGSSFPIKAISKIPDINNFTLGVKYIF